jgi:hypothetical protein
MSEERLTSSGPDDSRTQLVADPPAPQVEELSEEEAEELREDVKAVTLDEAHRELSRVYRRAKRGHLDAKRAWFLKDLLLAIVQVAKTIEERDCQRRAIEQRAELISELQRSGALPRELVEEIGEPLAQPRIDKEPR